jgi:lantibiotic modifying enzyme
MNNNTMEYRQMLNQLCIDTCNYKDYSKQKYNLFGSNASLILFLAYCKKNDCLPVNNEFENLMSDFIDSLNSIEVSDATFGSGLSGPAWLIQHLVSINILDFTDFSESLTDFDDLVYRSIVFEEHSKNYDLFMGLLGKAVYFLERYNYTKSEKHLNIITEFTNLLLSFSVHQENQLLWVGQLQNTEGSDKYEDATVLGFAHGLPSILVYLTKVFAITNSDELLQSIISLIKTIYQYQRTDQNKNKWFPHFIIGNIDYPINFNKRIAWCYGDLGLCYSLLFSAVVIKDTELMNLAKQLLLKLCDYRDLKETQIYDAGFCHGAAGAAHIFNRCNWLVEDPRFLKSSEYWFSVVKDFQKHSDSKLAKFKTFHFIGDEVSYTEDASLIYGTSGTGLTLISYIFSDFNWDNCFLL